MCPARSSCTLGLSHFSFSGATNDSLALALLSHASIAFRSRRPTDQVFRRDHHRGPARGAGVLKAEPRPGPPKELSGLLAAVDARRHKEHPRPPPAHSGPTPIFPTPAH